MKLIIRGKRTYIKRMYKHLRKEHPSTRQRMRIVPVKRQRHCKHITLFGRIVKGL